MKILTITYGDDSTKSIRGSLGSYFGDHLNILLPKVVNGTTQADQIKSITITDAP